MGKPKSGLRNQEKWISGYAIRCWRHTNKAVMAAPARNIATTYPDRPAEGARLTANRMPSVPAINKTAPG